MFNCDLLGNIFLTWQVETFIGLLLRLSLIFYLHFGGIKFELRSLRFYLLGIDKTKWRECHFYLIFTNPSYVPRIDKIYKYKDFECAIINDFKIFDDAECFSVLLAIDNIRIMLNNSIL